MQIISMTNQKGGVGKTTSSINLASILAESVRKVLLIDLDPQGNTGSGLGLRDIRMGTYDLLCGTDAKKVMQKSYHPNLQVICSNQHLVGAEIELVETDEREFILKQALSKVEGFDICIIDCPPSLGMLTLNALCASDFILIPVQAEFYALEGLSQLIENAAKIKSKWNDKLEVLGLILTMHDKRNLFHKEVERNVKNHFKNLLFETIIGRNIRLAEAASFGKSITEYDKFSLGCTAYKKLAKEIEERIWKKD